MGNSNSDPITSSAEAVKDNKEDFEVGHPCKAPFGHAVLWRHKKTGKVYMVKGRMMDEDAGEVQARIKFLVKKKSNCITLEGISRLESSQGWCAAVIYELRIDKLGLTLYDMSKKGFDPSEKELWPLLIGITKALGEYETARLDHGYVCPKSIVFDESNGSYSLLDKMFYDTNHFQGAKLQQKTHYCAPEAFNQISANFRSPVVQSAVRCDVFSLGLTLLTLIMPTFDLAAFYNPQDLAVNEGYLEHIVNSILEHPNQYSELLQSVIGDMVNCDELIRPNPSQLLHFFRRFEPQLLQGNVPHEAIMNYKEFSNKLAFRAYDLETSKFNTSLLSFH
jgi:hypothetical protein